MNNNKLDENALLAGCKGVFQKTTYVSIGTTEKPEEYVKKIPPRSVYAGKNFTTAPPREGKTVDTYFEKKHNWISQGAPYEDRIMYSKEQTEKKKGFYTSDFSKRDEFTNTIRTEQWREQLKGENKFAKEAIDMFASAAGVDATQVSPVARQEPDEFLYDRVFEKEDPTFSGASRTQRDTKNKTRLTRDRELGDQMTTTGLAFQPPTEHNKPEYANKPLIRDTFYRKTNVFFPGGCAADPTA